MARKMRPRPRAHTNQSWVHLLRDRLSTFGSQEVLRAMSIEGAPKRLLFLVYVLLLSRTLEITPCLDFVEYLLGGQGAVTSAKAAEQR